MIGPVGCRYLDDERQRGYVVNGWNVTGDTFVRDEDGYFFYRARTDNMIVSSGYNIGGPEVEAAIDTAPRRRRVAPSSAEPDAERGCDRLRLRRAARGRRRRRRQGQGDPGPRQAASSRRTSTRATCAFVDALPRNPSGKLQHFRLREQHGSRRRRRASEGLA